MLALDASMTNFGPSAVDEPSAICATATNESNDERHATQNTRDAIKRYAGSVSWLEMSPEEVAPELDEEERQDFLGPWLFL